MILTFSKSVVQYGGLVLVYRAYRSVRLCQSGVVICKTIKFFYITRTKVYLKF